MGNFLQALAPFCMAAGMAAQLPTYKVSIDPWMAWSPALVAEAKGMWKARGIDAQVVVYTANDSIHSFLAGRNDFVILMADKPAAVFEQLTGRTT